MTVSLIDILAQCGCRPVLIDIGASGTPPAIWDQIAKQSIYIGFDPDLRELHEVQNGRYFKSYLINEAVTTDPHSLPVFRINNVVSNMPEFEQAFSCKSGQKMVRTNACRVW